VIGERRAEIAHERVVLRTVGSVPVTGETIICSCR